MLKYSHAIKLLLLLLAACQPFPAQGPPEQVPSGWGVIQTLGEAERSAAPALWRSDSGETLLAWSGTDQAEARLYVRSNRDEAPIILALGVQSPFAETLLPAADGRYHLLWLDSAPGRTALNLYAATIAPGGVAELGPNALSEAPAYHYSAIADGNGGLWLAWSEGLSAMLPRLRLRGIDPSGRLRFSESISEAGDHPAWLLHPDGLQYLYWLRDSIILRGTFTLTDSGSADLVDVRSLGRGPEIAAGERLQRFVVNHDESHVYGFWQIINAQGQARVFWVAAPLNADRWPPVSELGLNIDIDQAYAAPYNVGDVQAASSGDTLAEWFALPQQSRRVLPLALTLDGMLGMAYLSEGVIRGYQPLAEIGPLMDAPALAINAAQDISLSWAEARRAAPARLRYMQTR